MVLTIGHLMFVVEIAAFHVKYHRELCHCSNKHVTVAKTIRKGRVITHGLILCECCLTGKTLSKLTRLVYILGRGCQYVWEMQ